MEAVTTATPVATPPVPKDRTNGTKKRTTVKRYRKRDGLTNLRKARGLTQAGLCELTGIPESTYGAIETGRQKNIPDQWATALMEFFSMDGPTFFESLYVTPQNGKDIIPGTASFIGGLSEKEFVGFVRTVSGEGYNTVCLDHVGDRVRIVARKTPA